ncbi:hypothetical protein [uncultured Erythrobacter sp.]|uniref:hypothetical protein n=1 Tax=uncultured Erythrobacter sp. TaxID=263913 RepID=UPI002609083E|nr:hypothetical protein [uncultured Erythrobacter sp.]
MKLTSIAAALMLGAAVTTPALADGHGDHAEAKAAKYTIDTPIEKLVADAKAKAVLEKHLPGIDQHPAYGEFKTMSLKAIQPFSQGAITPELLEKIAADLAAMT